MSRPTGKSRAATGTEDVADRLHSAAIHLLRRLRHSDKASGVSAARLSALSVLVFGGPCTLGALADAEQVRPPTMTRLVQALEAEGYIRRAPDPHDRRAVRLEATPKARRLLEKGRQRRIDAILALMSQLKRDDVRTLGRAASLMESMAGGEGSQKAIGSRL